MDRVIATDSVDAGHAAAPPADGVPQHFGVGDPAATPPKFPTEFPAYWAEGVQEELLAIIAAAGIAPNRFNTAQVLAAIKELIQHETGNYAPDTGAANVYVITPNPPLDAYTNGLPLRFLVANTNTGASTLNASALGAVTIVRDDGTALVAGDMPAGSIANVIYLAGGGGKFYLISTVQPNAAVAQSQATNYAADTGADGAHYVCALAPVLTAHKVGMPIRIKAAHDNTGAATFNPGPGAIAIKDPNGVDPVAGVIKTGALLELMYDGAVYQLRQVAPASAAQAKAAAAANVVMTPSNLVGHPGVAKAGVHFTVAAGVLTTVRAWNCAVARTGLGTYDVTLNAGVVLDFQFAMFMCGGANITGTPANTLMNGLGPYTFTSTSLANTAADTARGLILFY